jgi:rifampicin phosphotransferase
MLDGLPDGAREDLESRGWTAVQERSDLARLRVGLEAFLERFGHLSDSGNDFSLPTWREDRDHVVGLVLAHRSKNGPAPQAEAARGAPAAGVVGRVSPVRRPVVRMLWRRTGAFRVYRDAVGTTWARSYGLFRHTFLALGARLVARGVLDSADDVFYLSLDELRALAGHPGLPEHVPGTPGPTPEDARALVATRRAEVTEATDLVVPEVVYGDAFVPRRAGEVVDEELVGIPASRGSARGTARVVRSKADFTRVAAGEIIVIAFSDVAWTPLFARAAGAIAEAGGMLAHSAVVAREYGIPCIVSVPDACSRIPDGATVVIDGITGRVLVER